MPSRPQFSLRMLLFVMVMVCLAAATVSPTDNTMPVPSGLYHRSSLEPMSLAAHAQGTLRLAMCMALPAVLVAGAVNRRRSVRTFCIGALFPALTGLTMVCMRCDFVLEGLHKYLHAFGDRGYLMVLDILWKSLPELRYELATTWALAMGCGAAALFFARLFGLGEQAIQPCGAVRWPRYVWSVALFAAATICLVALTLKMPPRSMPSRHAYELLIVTLSMALQGVLAVGAVQSRKCVQAFCLGAALASCLGWAIICEGLLRDAVNRGNPLGWPYMHVVPHRYSFAAVWIFAPIFGMACGIFYRLFECGEAKTNGTHDRVEKSG